MLYQLSYASINLPKTVHLRHKPSGHTNSRRVHGTEPKISTGPRQGQTGIPLQTGLQIDPQPIFVRRAIRVPLLPGWIGVEKPSILADSQKTTLIPLPRDGICT
jgi:hypothetical protein